MMLGKFKNKTVNTKLKVNTNEIIEFIEGPSDEADIDICSGTFHNIKNNSFKATG